MSIEEGLKSTDVEIIMYYTEVALNQKYTIHNINALLNSKYKISIFRDGYYLVNKECSCKFKRKLNFTFKSEELCQ